MAQQNRALTAVAALVGLVLVVIGIVYFALPARSLPSFFPGHAAHSAHHHVKHGIAAVLLGLACFVYVWFSTGKRDTAVPV